MYEPYENQENQPLEEPTYFYTPPQDKPAVENTPVKKEKVHWPLGAIVAVGLVCSFLGGIFGAGGMYLFSQLLDDVTPIVQAQQDDADVSVIVESNREQAILDVDKIEANKLLTQAEVYAANVNSTVGITTSITTNYWGYQTTSAAAGSGFIFSNDGYILTNYHVVEDSNSITVTMYDGSKYDAKLIGYDQSNDVAVLKIEADNLVPVVLGNSDNIHVGDHVVAIGNPLGELTFSLTSGSISAKDREITMSSGNTMRLMQTDCAINSGNSGGALFNLYGEVIGITNAKYSSGSSSEASIDNIGFAIPINKARSIAESIIEKGYVSKPYVGISASTVSTESQGYGLPKGAAVRSVTADSPAAQAGIQINDIITHIDGKEISGSSELSAIVGNSAIGTKLVFTVYRQGKSTDITVTVGEQIQTNQQNQNTQSQSPQYPWGY